MDMEGLLPRVNVAVVLVDVQEKLFRQIHDKENILANILKVIQFCRRMDIPVLVTEQYPKGLGATLPEIQQALGASYKPMSKTVFSCFGAPEFPDALEETGADVIVLLGIETHICVLQTALTALASDLYDVVALADCIGARSAGNHQLGLDRMRDEGAMISSWEMFVYEMLVEAKTEDHERVFDLLK
jgi:nicotinamidase-related amidase